MKLPERFELLERYHDGEVSGQEATDIEALLASSGQALDYLGELDNLGELLREADDHEIAQVSFEGLWDSIHTGIEVTPAVQHSTHEVLAPARFELLERYHDGEVSERETADVEALLQHNPMALDYLGGLDNLSELLREADAHEVTQVSFEGLWTNVHAGIQKAEAVKAEAEKANQPSFGERMGAWLRTIFVENRSAWFAAAAAAAAVALVMNFMGNGASNSADPGVATTNVIEKHYIYVDSVDKTNPDDMVVVNSMQDDNTAVIWLLPDGAATKKGQPEKVGPGAEPNKDNDDGSVEIEEEPL